ncbi:hypothetical protein SCA6_004201 [Theobroma cacao]
MESEENNLSDAKYLHELSKDDILSLEFDNLEDVYEFYKAYAYAIGFGVRKDSCRRNKDGIEVMKHFACLKEGHRVEKWKKLENRMREPKSSSRTDCKANIRVILNKDTGKWYVSHCELKHNHHMVNLAQIGFIRSNRHIKVADVCEAKVMKVAGIKTCQVMNVFAAQARGIQNVGFMHKDFYNRMVAEEHAEENDGEVQATLLYFGVKKEIDSGFYMTHTNYEDNKLKNLFWVDSVSRSNYACFGDVLAFDTTYKKNTFNLPLLVFIDVNYHHMTTIFALALLRNEDAESYIWALSTFLECMMNKKPISVVIDEDRAMRKALKMTFPRVQHRLCSWYLASNAQANIPLPGFVQNFKACMKSWWTINKFERDWKEMVKKFALQGHQWIDEMYKKKHMWAQSHLSGHFFRIITSTSRYEGLNSFIAFVAKERKTLLEFVRAIEDEIKNIRNNEIGEDYISIHTELVSSQIFKDIEKHVASVYTRRTFKKFIDEMCLQQLFYHECRIDDVPSIQVYHLMKYGDLSERIRVEFHVDDYKMLMS